MRGSTVLRYHGMRVVDTKFNRDRAGHPIKLLNSAVWIAESNRIRKLRSAATTMAENGNREGHPVTITTTEDVGSSSAITESVENWDDFKLLRLTSFYRDRLAECLEEAVHDVILALANETEFSGREIQTITELADKGERAHSSKLLLNLVTEKGCRARRAMWDTFLKTRTGVPKLDEILKEIQQPGFVPSHDLQLARGFSKVSSDLTFGDVQRKHREALRAEGEALTVNVLPLRETNKFSQLDDRYAELTVIAAVGDRRLAEHELLAKGREHEVWREKHLRGELGKMRTDQMLQMVFPRSKSKSGSSAAVTGVAGIGKTTMVQRIVHDWATGKIGQQFQFVFYFKFLHLNTINCRINLRELILYQHPYIRNILGEIWKNPEGLLFIFDGLDEFQDIIYFANSATGAGTRGRCTDPEMRCKVSDIVYGLVQHKLLPGCSVLVTTRPTTLHFLEKMDICAWAEIIGTVGEERKEYFYSVFEDKIMAASIFKHVEGNEILYTMTYNPSYCRILAEALGPFFTQGDRDPQRVPKTITQLYSHYIYNILKNHKCETENPRDVLLRVGRMAFAGVSERKIMFTDGDLIEYDLQPFQFPSTFPTELLGRRESAHSATYAFPHLTIQEFVAALAQFLTSCRSDIGNLLTESHCATDGRFDLFLRFCAGLTSPETACIFEEFLGPFPDETARRVIDWVREAHESQLGSAVCHSGKMRLLNILHCLFEAQNRGLADATLGSAEALSFSGLRLTAIDSAVLAHDIGLCDAINHLDLTGCLMQDEKLQRLGPSNDMLAFITRVIEYRSKEVLGDAVQKKALGDTVRVKDLGDPNLGKGLGPTGVLKVDNLYQRMILGENAIGDSGMKLVSAALRNSECKIKKLCLNDNGLTQSCAEDLTSALDANRSLVELDLGENRLQDSGVKLLSAALRNPACQIHKLLLRDVDLTASCAEELSSALSANRSLTELDLGENRLEDCGVKLLSAALRNTCCKIKKLRLDHNRLTASCAEDLASVLSANYYLKELDLGFNKLGDPGMKFLASALKHPDCKLQALDLWDINLTSCCADDLASALTANQSLRVLNLGANELGDSAAQLVTEALKGTECKMRDLCLWDAGLTDSCIEHLASALGTVDTLKYLDLGSNGLTDRSVPALHRLIQTSANLQRIRLRANQLGPSGKRELETLEESRPGLRVSV
ncbi:NACHT, LRR and PYD domains-containing protein 3-like [Mobula birostris]|uniref:NACHT, LRR and PYD domains-containing protein 3-like n=1 Tax=Mobula birostris TaxID=1983395 RepID=UPI003B280695